MIKRIIELAVILGATAAILCFAAGCDEHKSHPISQVATQSDNCYVIEGINDGFETTFRIVVIDGCEYFYEYGMHGGSTLCHKGNCTNAIHQYNRIAEKP